MRRHRRTRITARKLTVTGDMIRGGLLALLLGLIGACSGDLDPTVVLNEARHHMENQEYRQAGLKLKKLLQQDASNAQARRLLGEVYLVMHDGVGAEAQFRKIRGAQADAGLQVELGRALLYQGKFDEATAAVAKVAEDSPAYQGALLVQARAALLQGDSDRAGELYQQIVRDFGESPEALLGLEQASRPAGRKPDVSRLQAIVDKWPDDIEARLALAEAQYQTGEYEQARQGFLTVVNDMGLTRERVEMFRARNGLINLGLRDKSVDLASLQKFEQDYPGHFLPKYYLGLWHYTHKDYDAALPFLQEALKRNGNFDPAMLLLGGLNYYRGAYEQAETLLTRYLGHNPGNVQARMLLAAVHEKQRRFDEASDVLGDYESTGTQADAGIVAMLGRNAMFAGDLDQARDYYEKARKIAPQSTAISSELARVYMMQGDMDKAISELEQMGDSDTRSGEMRDRMLILAHLKKRDFAKSLELLKALQDRHPQDPAVFVFAGQVNRLAGDRAGARRAFDRALQLDGKHVGALLGEATLALGEQRWDEAASWFDKVLLRAPDNVDAMVGQAVIAEQLGNNRDVLSWLEAATEKGDPDSPARNKAQVLLAKYYARAGEREKAQEVISDAYENNRDDLAIVHAYAGIMANAGRNDEAIAAMQQAVQRYPDNPQLYYSLARLQFRAGALERAEAAVRQALDLRPDFIEASVFLATVRQARGENKAAIDIVRGLQRKHPDIASLYLTEGDLYLKAGQLGEAAAAFDKAHQVHPSLLTTFKVARLRLLRGRTDEALAVMQDWLDHHPDDVLAQLNGASLYQEAGRLDQARALYEQAIKAQPDHAVALNNLAWIYSQTGDARASDMARRAYEASGGDGLVADTYGWILYQAGNYDRAAPLLGQAYEQYPRQREIAYHYASLKLHQGDPQEATTVLDALPETPAGKPAPFADEIAQLRQRIETAR